MPKANKRRSRTAAAQGVSDAQVTGSRDYPFPIVGIGASAGGLEAFSQLLEHLPLDAGMAFVLVQHLDPQHESALANLLQRKTSIPVQEVTNNLRVRANHIYVIPPNANLGIVSGVLKLGPRDGPRSPARSIDSFFEALAADQHERAIGVVLSGTASDGTIGLEKIKAEGGVTFAQDGSARYDSMPRNAIAAGCVDFVLSPKDIANELVRIAKHPAIANGLGESPESASTGRDDDVAIPSTRKKSTTEGSARTRAGARRATRSGAGAEDGLRTILLLLRNHCGIDFSLYKSSTIQRRITRRMILGKHDTLEDYAKFLRGNASELDGLYGDSLINVTSFFRNPDAFDVLQRKVWPAILQQRSDDPVRVWVLGCSSGQEAYSIAISFVEAAENAPKTRKLQVFATDLNETILDKARHGLYAKTLVQDLSTERLRRFFVEEGDGYRVTKQLREMVVFARQNLLGDPPFSRMDLVSCRNLLIYFEPDLQKKVFPVFHYALKPDGYLYLGASESIGTFTDLFEAMDKKHKIYKRKSFPSAALQLPLRRTTSEQPSPRLSRQGKGRERASATSDESTSLHQESNVQREADRIAVNHFAPPGVLINSDLQVLQFRGVTSEYLEPPTGKASFDVLKMARNGLMLPLRAAISKAKKDKKTVRKENVRFEKDGKTRAITVEVIPLVNLRELAFLIIFEETRTAGRRRADTTPPLSTRLPRGATARRVAELESALAETRDYLQSLQEQYEAANEELQSSNEEVQSANEELQSLNEELETSKEELESANEELTTFNEEIADRNAELGRLNAELTMSQKSVIAARDHAEAIIRTIRDPFLILTGDLRVHSANDAFLGLFKVTRDEIEKQLIYDLGHGQWDVQRLRQLLEEILPRNSFFNDLEVSADFDTIGRRTLLLNARTLTDGENTALILLGIHDVTEVLQFQAAARSVEARYRALVEASASVIWTTDTTGAVVENSPSWQDFTGQTVDEARGWGWIHGIHPDDRHRALDLWLRSVASRTPFMTEYRLQHSSGDWRWTEVRAVPVPNADGSVREWIGTNTDVHERHTLTDTLREADQNKNVFLAMLAHELRNPLAPLRHSTEILRRLLLADAERQSSDYRGDRQLSRASIEMMERQIVHMSGLVDDLLDVSRISRGKFSLHMETVELGSIVRQAVDVVLPAVECKDDQLTMSLPSGPVYVSADPKRMAQIVGNLLHNACKFTQNGTIDITLESDAPDSDAPHAVIRVRDSGIGIAPEQLERIFDLFSQVDASLDRPFGGLGIGLSLVKTLSEMHGGTIEAYSAGLGRGAEFVVRLPLSSSAPEDGTGPLDTNQRTTPSRRVLIVDDDADSAESLAVLLTMQGHVTRTVGDGLEAVEVAAAFEPEVALLDIGLPSLDGYEVGRRIRAQAGKRSLTLVALTGWGQKEDRNRSKEAGFDAHLVKPIDRAHLERFLAEEK